MFCCGSRCRLPWKLPRFHGSRGKLHGIFYGGSGSFHGSSGIFHGRRKLPKIVGNFETLSLCGSLYSMRYRTTWFCTYFPWKLAWKSAVLPSMKAITSSVDAASLEVVLASTEAPIEVSIYFEEKLPRSSTDVSMSFPAKTK